MNFQESTLYDDITSVWYDHIATMALYDKCYLLQTTKLVEYTCEKASPLNDARATRMMSTDFYLHTY